ncbi:kinase-like domain-containing protein [Gilbertella persicaria]|uniref:non-specific serine/threonine protein kinase n=1 Tax=Rhizopus stolonifer TaxID=4846 RepID=A0A367JQL8_RHIST|nr:kinase-like domain-containing protein [Gilbertella persicaria]KAI8049145.1 kinase-like domain-containing protein [Gilbertella persicaria]RCH92237.1 hypothetical protein CU098_003587 [Rhizopus stolonifer]
MTIINSTMASPSPQRRLLAKFPHNKHINSPIMSPGNRRRKDVGDYWLGKTLGRGSSGRVKVGIHKVTGEKVAIKIISKSHLAANASVEKAVKREIAVMKLISHPNIMSLLDVVDLSDSPNLYLVLEYVQGGELFEYLVSQGRLSEAEARKYFQQIIIGLDYCHRHLICHRDLKPENLLLDREKNIKIADFGMASLQPTGSLLETSCGSPHYASPEIVNGIPYDGSASDIWSCGIILYALLSGYLPFDDDNIRQLLNKVKVGKYKIPDHISDEARDLITKILVINPSKRLTMKQVQSHPWFIIDPPPNLTTLPDPPTAKEIGRPVASVSEIDDRILETLKVLWTDLSTEQVVHALLNSEYNMQKVTYVLLQRHANSYWQEERDDDIRSVSSPAKRRRPATICAVSQGKEPFPGLNEMMAKLAEREKISNAPQIVPGIQPQRLTSPSSSDATLKPTISSSEYDDSPPPPVPPKPIIIRADQVQPQNQWQFTPVQQRRQSLWHTPLTSRPNANRFSSNRQEQAYSNSPVSPFNPYYNVLSQPPPQPQQHMSVNHMLSPRTPASSVLHQQNHHHSYKQQQHQYLPQQDSKLNRFMNMWQRNHRVDPTPPPSQHTFRLSMPPSPQQKSFCFDRKALESSSSVWKDPSVQTPLLYHEQSSTPKQKRSSFVMRSPQHQAPSRVPHQEPPMESPKLTSWLPGLFHFKQPKVCSLECEARDEREAIGKLSQVLQEYMEGYVTERQDPDGRIRRKGEMKLPHQLKPVLLKFKLEIYQLQTNQKRRVYRINFIQQQGDAMALAAAVKLVDKTLQTYEHEAELVATANGWNIRNNNIIM